MADVPVPVLTPLAKGVLVLIAVLVVVGATWHGVSLEVWQRMWRDLADRPGGPMTFRFIVQPTMAAIAAWRRGVADAAEGRRPFAWVMLRDGRERRRQLNEGLIAIARIALLSLGMDTVYQLSVFGTFYPIEAINIAVVLVCVPYLVFRAPFARLARRRAPARS